MISHGAPTQKFASREARNDGPKGAAALMVHTISYLPVAPAPGEAGN